MVFSGRRIKTPERGLLTMHPFVDVLEGRSLFTATAHDGVMDVAAVVDQPAREQAASPWSSQAIGGEAVGGPADGADDVATAVEDANALVARTTPGRIELSPRTTAGAFSAGATIGDTNETLFGNAVWDRRGGLEPVPLPTDAEIAAARAAGDGLRFFVPDADGRSDSPFAAGRSMTGAMAPYLTMRAHHVEHLFAA